VRPAPPARSVAIALLAIVAAVAPAAPAAAMGETDPADCTVTAATLTWGFKESFRSYISGSIARGAWETIDGATYTTPAFHWSAGTGTVAPDGTVGAVSFPGGIRFTGHDGLLDTTVARPALELSTSGARLLLDVAGVSMENAMAGNTTVDTATQTPFVTVDPAAIEYARAGDVVTLSATDAATAMTEEGFAAFGSYPAGTAFDPISFTVTAQCPAPTPTAEAAPSADAAASGTPDATLVATRDSALPIGAIAGIGAAIAAAAVAAWILVRRRRRRHRAGAEGDGS